MRILGYIGTYNEGIEQSLHALLRQSHPLDGIIIVDNASSHSQPVGPFPAHVTVVRRDANLGPAGAISGGLEHALELGYDWIWTFDADSSPRPDALKKLLDLYYSFDLGSRRRIGILSCCQLLLPTTRMFQGRRLTPGGPRLPKIRPDVPYCECDSVLWSGSLINLETVRTLGMPRHGAGGYWDGLSHDYSDVDFSYRVRQAGYRVLVHRFSIVDHSVGESKSTRILGIPLSSTNHSAIRRYLFFRNLVYFWLYVYPRKNWPLFAAWFVYRLGVTLLGIITVEDKRASKIKACLRGIRHGISKSLSHEPSWS